MRIVQVIDQLQVGGAERVLVDLSNLLHENGNDVTVLCLLYEAKLDYELNSDIPVIYLHRKNKYNPIYLIRLYSILKQFDMIHVHLRQVLRYVSLLFYTSRLHNKKVVVFHDHFGRINTEVSLRPSVKKAMQNCKAYIGVSQQLVEWAQESNVNSTIFKLSNIVRTFSNSNPPVLSSEVINIVSVGNFRPQKNYEFLCQLIEASHQNYNFTIYGQIVDIEYYNKIINLIEQLEISDKVSIITDCNNTLNELQKFHLAVHCAMSETGPLVALEYLNAQIPFVAYNTGEVAQDASLVFPFLIQKDFEIKNWLRNIKNILESRESLKEPLKEHFLKHYSENAYTDKCVAIYEELISQ